MKDDSETLSIDFRFDADPTGMTVLMILLFCDEEYGRVTLRKKDGTAITGDDKWRILKGDASFLEQAEDEE